MPDSVVVYGSLISKKEHSALDVIEEALPVRVEGFKRVFNQEATWRKGSGRNRAVLNVMRSKENWFNGILLTGFEMRDLEALDERERGYERIEIEKGLIEFYDHPAEPRGRIWTYTGKRIRSDIMPIPSYLDLCIEGAREWGDRFYRDFLDTTFLSDGRTLREFLQADK